LTFIDERLSKLSVSPNTFSKHIAIKNGFGQIIKKLLEAKADVNSVVKENGKESTALMLACMLGESYIMDILLQYNATDYDRKVFNYAKDNKPTLLSILLKYRTSRDNEFPIMTKAILYCNV
jgi:ankyrin repeat protein